MDRLSVWRIGVRDLTTVMGAILTRCVLLAGLAQTGWHMVLGGECGDGMSCNHLPGGAEQDDCLLVYLLERKLVSTLDTSETCSWFNSEYG